MSEQANKRKVLDIRVYCTGVKNRCRKPDRHSFDVVTDLNPELFNQEAMEIKAVAVVTNSMKSLYPGRQVIMSVQEVTIEKHDGYETRSFMLFSDKKTDLTSRLQA